ncbi:sialate O-acetylesterase [Ferrimonas pelagia]|uniref:Sialate O-acetylesterase n=1 Tax=Ferrimonas pelagia TaxID=1177826 RepID=A0ABP9EW39_9GAMM
MVWGLLSTQVVAMELARETEITMPRFFGSGMVLQRDRPIPLWGKGQPGAQIQAGFVGQPDTVTRVDDAGRWRLRLPAQATGSAKQLQIRMGQGSEAKSLIFDDVLMGEVWLSSGQSNMWWPMRQIAEPQLDPRFVNLPNVRMLQTPRVGATLPAEDLADARIDPRVEGQWQAATSNALPKMSAVPFYFAQALQQALEVPVGIIVSAYGGTSITQWLAQPEPAVVMPGFGDKGGAGALYNGMLAPYAGLPIQGVLWYQGESSLALRHHYAQLQLKLVEQFRADWQQKDLPFFLVQLAPYKTDRKWAELSQAQLEAYRMGEHMGLVITNDLGGSDIHPSRKQEVGLRLVRWALKEVYGQSELLATGPLVRDIQPEGQALRIAFDFVGVGLQSKDQQPLRCWEVAGEAGAFVPAQAYIDGKSVLVRAESVERPVRVRLAFDGAAEHNLINSEALPASPFQYHLADLASTIEQE